MSIKEGAEAIDNHNKGAVDFSLGDLSTYIYDVILILTFSEILLPVASF